MTVLFRYFRRAEKLPVGSREIADALRGAAQLVNDDGLRREYTAAADALDRAISRAESTGDKNVRDDLMYALGRVHVNLRGQLSELIETVKEQVIVVQGEQQERQLLASAIYDMAANQQRMAAAVAEQSAAFGRQATATIEMRDELERWHQEFDVRLNRLEKRAETQERASDDSRRDRAAMRQELAALAEQVHQFEARLKGLMAEEHDRLARNREANS